MKHAIRIAAAVVAGALLLNLAGCATSATSQAMTIKPGITAAVNPKLKGQVAIAEVKGGKDTNPLWTSQVDAPGFKKALTDSLAIAGYLAPEGTKARYQVSANLVSLDQPFGGFTMDVKSDVKYQLTGGAAPRSIDVKATGSATVSDAFVGFERLRIANERSVMENIKDFINQLAAYAE